MVRLVIRKLMFAATASVLLTGGAYAECVPYETVLVPKNFSCTLGSGTDKNRFDDFSVGGCKTTPEHYVQIPKECPPEPEEPGLWVAPIVKKVYHPGNTNENGTPYGTNQMLTHAETCASVGLQPSHLNGAICTSGGLMPSKGGGWDKISYPYGTAGKVGDGGGTTAQDFGSVGYYCWITKPKKKDPDDRLVAWFCNEPGSPPPPAGSEIIPKPNDGSGGYTGD